MPAPYLSLTDLAKLYRISPRTVREWARADRWRTTGARPKQYHLGDAQQSYEARRAGRVIKHLVKRYAVELEQKDGTTTS